VRQATIIGKKRVTSVKSDSGFSFPQYLQVKVASFVIVETPFSFFAGMLYLPFAGE